MDISPRSFQESNKKNLSKQEENRSFFLVLANGVFSRIGFKFVDSGMVLSAFVKVLTGSNILIGLTGSTMRAGWMWPQLIMSNLLEHRPRKMPFYILGVTSRTIAWISITVLTIKISNNNYQLLFLCFYLLYFLACSFLGISTLPFNDIVAKTIPVKRRSRLFAERQFIGEIFGIGVGFLIKFILSSDSGLSFPNNYATIFTLATFMMIGSSLSFILIREPIHPVQDSRRSFWKHLGRGPYFLKKDRDYRYFLAFRVASTFGSMCVPFYIPYALDRLSIPEHTIGSFIAAGAISGVLSNILWGYICEKNGSKTLIIVSHLFAVIAPIIAASVRYIPEHRQITYYFLVFIITRAFMSGSIIAYMTYSLNLAPSKSRPTYLGFLNTIMFPLSFVPVLAGVLLKIMSYELMFILSAAMAFLAVYVATNLSNVDKRDEIELKDD